jgi:site-specific recombinase XerD
LAQHATRLNKGYREPNDDKQVGSDANNTVGGYFAQFLFPVSYGGKPMSSPSFNFFMADYTKKLGFPTAGINNCSFRRSFVTYMLEKGHAKETMVS